MIQIEGNSYNTLENETKLAGTTFSSTSTLNGEMNKEDTESDLKNIGASQNADQDHFMPLRLPKENDKLINKIHFFVSWPLLSILYLTVPNCRKSNWE